MNLLNGGIGRISAVMLVCAMLCHAQAVQAQPKVVPIDQAQTKAQPARANQAQPKPVTAANPFDHSKTGFLLRDVHATLKCEQCHVDGIFKNTPKECAGCHSTGTRVAAKPKPNNHVATSNPCDACHVSAANFLVKSYNHSGITGNCSTCHNGQSLGVVSKPATHFPTLQPCEMCHTNTSTFLSWRMDHTGLTSGCNACHGGPVPLGGPASATYPNVVSINTSAHIAIGNADCSTCHINFNSFGGAGFAHDSTANGVCGTCHRGQLAGTVSIDVANHIPNTYGNACDQCHTPSNTSGFKSFKGVVFHLTANGSGASPLSVPCSSCHNGAYEKLLVPVRGVNAGHVAIGSMDCSTCHTSSNTTGYQNFLGATFSHIPYAYPATFPPDVPGSPRCDTCHVTGNGGAKTMPAVHVPYTVGGAQDCNGCHTIATTGCPNCASFLNAVWTHTGTYPGGFPTTVAQAASKTCTSCHGSGAGGAKMKPAGHVATTQDCILCHVASGTGCPNCSTFLNAVFSHQPGIYSAFPAGAPATPTCGSCHLTGVGGAKKYSPTHGTKAADCITCHSNTNTLCPNCVNFTTGGAAYNHSPTPYASFPTVAPASPLCNTCHNGSTATGKNPGHVLTTSDCSACHLSSPGCSAANAPCSSFLNATSAGPHNVPPYTGKTCVSCHDGMQAKGLSSNPNHIPVGGVGCDQCHPIYDGTTSVDFSTAAVTGLGGTSPKYAMNHSAVSGRCDSCHNGSYTGQGTPGIGAVGKVTGHIPTTITGSLDCTTCHTTLIGAGIKVTSGSADWLPEKMNHNGAQGNGGGGIYCKTCHDSNGTKYLGTMDRKSITHDKKTPTPTDCSMSGCHRPLGSKGTAYSKWN